MAPSGRHVLVLAPADSPVERLVPSLKGAGFAVHRLPSGPAALELVQATPFELVIATTPLAGLVLAELVAAIRSGSAPCRRAGLLVAALDDPAEAEALLGRGVNRVVRGTSAGRLLEAAADLLQVEPRRRVRAVVSLRDTSGRATRHEVARTRDLSLTGMLVFGAGEYSVGSRFAFELLLPGDARVIRGQAAVVRQTDCERERIEGFGAAFERLEDDGPERLAGFLDHG